MPDIALDVAMEGRDGPPCVFFFYGFSIVWESQLKESKERDNPDWEVSPLINLLMFPSNIIVVIILALRSLRD